VTAESPVSRGTGSVPLPVAPTRFVRMVIRPMTKVLNPVIVRFAGRRHFAIAAQIQHVGRRSGKVYVTPASAHVHGDVILIALTFGKPIRLVAQRARSWRLPGPRQRPHLSRH